MSRGSPRLLAHRYICSRNPKESSSAGFAHPTINPGARAAKRIIGGISIRRGKSPGDRERQRGVSLVLIPRCRDNIVKTRSVITMTRGNYNVYIRPMPMEWNAMCSGSVSLNSVIANYHMSSYRDSGIIRGSFRVLPSSYFFLRLLLRLRTEEGVRRLTNYTPALRLANLIIANGKPLGKKRRSSRLNTAVPLVLSLNGDSASRASI